MKCAAPGRNGRLAAICALLLAVLVSQAGAFVLEAGAGPALVSGHEARGAQEAGAQEAPAEAPGKSKKPEPERGYAAFYSSSLEGHKTACGGVYSASKFTAAHPRLRCGTKLRVTNLRNGKIVRVTVTDHGPFSNGRILDLSYAAAVHLDFIKQGTTLVKVEVLR